MLVQDLCTQCEFVVLQSIDVCLFVIVCVQSAHVYVGPGFVSMSPASKSSVSVGVYVLFPGLNLASASFGFGDCHPPAGKRG